MVQALLLRGRARMAAGDTEGARQGEHRNFMGTTSSNVPQQTFLSSLLTLHVAKDLHKVLDLQPDHAVATSLLSITNSSGVKTVRLLSSRGFLFQCSVFRAKCLFIG